MVQTILTPTDGNDNSFQAIKRAVQIAKPFDATIHAVSVVKQTPTRDRLRYDPIDDADEAIETTRELVEQEGIEFVGTVREGLPHEQIIMCADEHNADMIVMGTHGRSELDRVLLGSVAERTLQKSTVLY